MLFCCRGVCITSDIFFPCVTGADIIKGDGIYSRYFPNLTGFGHYMLTVDILDSQGYTVTGTEAADKSSTGTKSEK